MPFHTFHASAATASRRHLGSIPRRMRFDDAPPRAAMSAWGARERPATAAEEAVFVDRIRQLAARTSHDQPGGAAFQRYDITAVVTALRNGVTADELFRSAPGLRPESIAAAYDHVEQQRQDAADAWRTLATDPSANTLLAVGDRAAVLLPAVISRLNSLLLLGHSGDPLTLEQAIAAIDREISATEVRALTLERTLTDSTDPVAVARAAELLVGDCSDGLWSLASFLPPRVGTLVSGRLRGMLGEQAAETEQYRARARSRRSVA